MHVLILPLARAMLRGVILGQHMARTSAPTPLHGLALIRSRSVGPHPTRGGHLPASLVLGGCSLGAREAVCQKAHHTCRQGHKPLGGPTRTVRAISLPRSRRSPGSVRHRELPHGALGQVSCRRVTVRSERQVLEHAGRSEDVIAIGTNPLVLPIAPLALSTTSCPPLTCFASKQTLRWC